MKLSIITRDTWFKLKSLFYHRWCSGQYIVIASKKDIDSDICSLFYNMAQRRPDLNFKVTAKDEGYLLIEITKRGEQND